MHSHDMGAFRGHVFTRKRDACVAASAAQRHSAQGMLIEDQIVAVWRTSW